MSIRRQLVAWSIILTGSAGALTRTAPGTPPDRTAIEVRNHLQLNHVALETPSIAAIDADHVNIAVRIDGVERVLELELRSLRGPDFRVLAQYEVGGPLVEVDAPPLTTYAGHVRDVPGSSVRASLIAGQIKATIRYDDEVFGIQPIDEFGVTTKAGTHAVYRQSDVVNDGHQCGVGALGGAIEPPVLDDHQRQAAGGALLVTDISLDSDFDFYNDNGQNMTSTINSIEGFMNGVAGVYEEPDIGITYLIGTIIVRTVPGTYTETAPSALLNQFQATWLSPPESGIPRDIAHLYTGKNMNGSTIGIAQLSVICNTSGVGLSENFTSNFNSMVALTAHELGHNWSAQHCNNSGTCRIMCSGLGGCNGINPLTFADAAAQQIVDKRDSSSCLTPDLPATTLPFCEDWSVPGFDPERWSYTSGATITALGSLNPSEPFALKLNAASDSDFSDDELRSNEIDLSGQNNVVFSYHTEHIGVEIDEILTVEYWSNSNDWVVLNTIVSDGLDQFVYRYHEHVLPGNANHSDFRIRFRVDVNSFTDEWLVDDISLDCFPAPVCSPGCDDGQVCTTNEFCDGTLCVGSSIDCSSAGDQCNTAACDQNGVSANCDMLIPVTDGTSCNGGAGFCQAGQCIDPSSTARVFMAAAGDQGSANGLGTTELIMAQGSTARVMVWLSDNGSAGDMLNAYQVMLPDQATPLAGAAGSVSYLDNDPGTTGGDSVTIDTNRSDWIFANEPAILSPVFSEATDLGLFGAFYSTIQGLGVDPSSTGVNYLMEFDIVASAGALGDFEFRFNAAPSSPPHTNLFTPQGQEFISDQFQPLIVTVVEGANDCASIADCADINGDEIRDDNCVWWACQVGTCIGTDVVFADMSGQFGACPPDGTADGNDRFQALNCFADFNPKGGAYACEAAPPTAYNVDAGGQFGSCNPDGVCDGNDAFAALNAFGGTTTCSCPLDGPAPHVPREAPAIVGEAIIRLELDRKTVRPGQLLHVDVFLDAPMADLRGYQLHLGASGGLTGQLELVDIALRRPTVLGTQPQLGALAANADMTWSAFNVESSQLLVGMDQPGTAVQPGYLGTFVYRASRNASGRFSIDVLHGDDPDLRTFAFPTAPHGRVVISAPNNGMVNVSRKTR